MDEDEKQGEEHERRTRRSLVLLAAKIRTADGVLDARLRNLSQNGALLEGDKLPRIGSEVVFERGATNVRARVAWVLDGRFGLEFLTPIAESEVLIHVGRPKPSSSERTQVFRRSGLHSSSLSAGEKRFAEDWVRSSGRPFGD